VSKYHVKKRSNDNDGPKTIVELDGFNDFTNEIEGADDNNMSGGIIQGTKIKFLDPRWVIDKTEKDITGKLLTAIAVVNVVNKWGHDGELLEKRILAPGEKFPDFEKLNAKCPSEWRENFGKMVGPWSGQHVVYFVDELLNRYTWASPITTVGSAICVSELARQIQLVRKFRGSNVYPVVELGRTDFPTSYGLRQRPYLLNIKDWIKLGADQPGALPASDSTPEIAPTAPGGAPAGAQSVSEPTAKEVTDDEIKY